MTFIRFWPRPSIGRNIIRILMRFQTAWCRKSMILGIFMAMTSLDLLEIKGSAEVALVCRLFSQLKQGLI